MVSLAHTPYICGSQHFVAMQAKSLCTLVAQCSVQHTCGEFLICNSPLFDLRPIYLRHPSWHAVHPVVHRQPADYWNLPINLRRAVGSIPLPSG